jgi:hypothetical protein
VSIEAEFLDFATEEGRVSGSKRAFKTRASLKERSGVADEMAMLEANL